MNRLRRIIRIQRYWVVLIALGVCACFVSAAEQVSWDTCYDAGVKAHSAGQYQDAAKHFQQAVNLAKEGRAPEGRTLARSLTSLAEAYGNQCDYAQAEPLLKQAMELDEKAGNTEHPGYAPDVA